MNPTVIVLGITAIAVILVIFWPRQSDDVKESVNSEIESLIEPCVLMSLSEFQERAHALKELESFRAKILLEEFLGDPRDIMVPLSYTTGVTIIGGIKAETETCPEVFEVEVRNATFDF